MPASSVWWSNGRPPHAGSKAFGEHGPFERLEGTVYMEVNPADPLNAVIINFDKAPRNATGHVEFSAPTSSSTTDEQAGNVF